MGENITQNIDGGILTLTIARPEKKNALTVAMYAALADAITAANNDKAVRVILITGSEDSFTAILAIFSRILQWTPRARCSGSCTRSPGRKSRWWLR
jgi:enoyl-CoA hydratase/carnithine racemase